MACRRGKRLKARAEWHFGRGPDYCANCRAVGGACGARCPYEQHAPLSIAGAAVWQACVAAVTADMAGVRLDVAGALTLAVAAGAAPDEAADLIPAVLAGMIAAQTKGGDDG